MGNPNPVFIEELDDKESLIDSWITWTFILSNHWDNSKARYSGITKLQTWYSAVGKKVNTIFYHF